MLPWVLSIRANENAHILRVGVSNDVTATQSFQPSWDGLGMDERKSIISNKVAVILSYVWQVIAQVMTSCI